MEMRFTSVSTVKVTCSGNVVFRERRYFLPVECFKVERIQVGYHLPLGYQATALDELSFGEDRTSYRLTKRYIFDPTTVVDAPWIV